MRYEHIYQHTAASGTPEEVCSTEGCPQESKRHGRIMKGCHFSSILSAKHVLSFIRRAAHPSSRGLQPLAVARGWLFMSVIPDLVSNET